MRSVPRSNELERILALPRRGEQGIEDLVDPLSKFLARPDHVCRPPGTNGPNDRGCAGGATRLNHFQVQGLVEFHDYNRLWVQGPLGVGKTALSFLCFTISEAKRPLLVIPGGGRTKTMDELKVLREHWRVPPFQLVSYQKISRTSGEFFFIEPPGPYDVVIFDEVHYCSNEDAAVTRRFQRFRDARGAFVNVNELRVFVPATVKVGVMTATPAKDSITDFYHTMEWTADEMSPLPRNDSDISDWAGALDANPAERIAPGVLTQFSGGSDTLEHVRRGVAKRIFETPGFISSSETFCDAKLTITLRNIPLTPEEDHWYRHLRGDPDNTEEFPGWVTPDGEIFMEPADLWRHACSLALGYTTYWDPPAPPEWRKARYEWHHGARELISESQTYDTFQHVANAVDDGKFPHLKDALEAWREIQPTFEPNSVPRWVGDTALRYAQSWFSDPGIVWTQHIHFGRELAKRTGYPFFEEGGWTQDRSDHIHRTTKDRIIASVAANSAQYNLQRFNRNLLSSIWPTGRTVEQCIGRTHRQGQKRDVIVDWAISCAEQQAGFTRAATMHSPFYTQILQMPSRLSYGEIRSETITQTGWAFRTQQKK